MSGLHRSAELLLVEDNPDDVELTRLALDRTCVGVRLHVVADGEACLRFLREGAPRPDLVLLDLNMPGMDGRETLAEIARDEDLRGVPVVVLTTSSREEDVAEAYRLGCAGYVVKPV